MSKQDSPAAFDRLLDYIDTTGPRSMWLALDADRTLNATAHASKLASNTGAGSTEWGGIVYLYFEFELFLVGSIIFSVSSSLRILMLLFSNPFVRLSNSISLNTKTAFL